jgi:hypothetical protein
MWRGLETGEKRALASFSIRFVRSHIHSIFNVNIQMYKYCIYPAIKITEKMLFNLIIIKR